MNTSAIPSQVWSASLQQETLAAIEELRCDPQGKLHFKHHTLGWATADIQGLMSGTHCLQNKQGGEQYTFDCPEQLLAAGWCVD